MTINSKWSIESISIDLLAVLLQAGNDKTLRKVFSDFVWRNGGSQAYQIEAADKLIVLERSLSEKGISVLGSVLGATTSLMEEDYARRYFYIENAFWLIERALQEAYKHAQAGRYDKAESLWQRAIRVALQAGDIGHLESIKQLAELYRTREPDRFSAMLERVPQQAMLDFAVRNLTNERKKQDANPTASIRRLLKDFGIKGKVGVTLTYPQEVRISQGSSVYLGTERVELGIKVPGSERKAAFAILRKVQVVSPHLIGGTGGRGMNVGGFEQKTAPFSAEFSFVAPITPHAQHPLGRKQFSLHIGYYEGDHRIERPTRVLGEPTCYVRFVSHDHQE